MKIGIEIDWQKRNFVINRERLQLVDELGYDVVFCAEGFGNDAITPLGYVLGSTKRIGVGTRVISNPARTPGLTAMTFQTMRHIAPEREIIAGLGSHVVEGTEGFHGLPWTPAYPRMKELVEIMRQAFRGEELHMDGKAFTIPYHKPGEEPKYPAMQFWLEPRPNPPQIFFGGGTELMIGLAAQIADGMMPNGGWAPGDMKIYKPLLEKGFAKRESPPKLEDFPLWAHIDVLVTDDVKEAMAQFKEYVVRWTGGYYNPGGHEFFLINRGYGELVPKIKELYAAGRIKEAEALVPDEYIDQCWLFGPMDRILSRWRSHWVDDGCNLIIRTDNWPSAKLSGNEVYEPLLRAMLD